MAGYFYINNTIFGGFMLFPTNQKVPLVKNEIVKVILNEGHTIFGIVEDVNGDVVWLKSGTDENSRLARFNFKIDKFIKLN